jgi:hypothetical protein
MNAIDVTASALTKASPLISTPSAPRGRKGASSSPSRRLKEPPSRPGRLRISSCARWSAANLARRRKPRLLARRQPDEAVDQREQVLDAVVQFTIDQLPAGIELLGVVDVGRRAVPAQDVAVAVAHRHGDDAQPAIDAVMAAEAIVDVVGATGGKRLPPRRRHPLAVVGMDHAGPYVGRDPVCPDPGELAPPAVEVIVPPLRVRAPDDLRDGFHQRFEAQVAVAQRGGRLGLAGDVDDDPGEGDDRAAPVADRAAGRHVPAQPPLAGGGAEPAVQRLAGRNRRVERRQHVGALLRVDALRQHLDRQAVAGVRLGDAVLRREAAVDDGLARDDVEIPGADDAARLQRDLHALMGEVERLARADVIRRLAADQPRSGDAAVIVRDRGNAEIEPADAPPSVPPQGDGIVAQARVAAEIGVVDHLAVELAGERQHVEDRPALRGVEGVAEQFAGGGVADDDALAADQHRHRRGGAQRRANRRAQIGRPVADLAGGGVGPVHRVKGAEQPGGKG